MIDPAPAATAAAAAPSESAPLLEVREISRHFGGLIAVNNVSFGVQPGDIFGLIGPNGAGKTTLFNVITGLIPPTGGKLVFRGEDLTRRSPHRIASKGIARTFQNIRLFSNLSALQNVMIARHLHTRASLLAGVLGLPSSRNEERATREQAFELLRLVGLDRRAGQIVRNFPYGDQRRIEIARALALEPTLLLLDEPAAGMNQNEKAELSDFIKRICDRFDLTVVVIEHHVPLVMGLCNRVAVLNFGRLIALGSTESVRNDPAVIEAYLGAE